MTDAKHPTVSPKGKQDAEERRRRQAEALRTNLARRKAQTRARDTAAEPEPRAETQPEDQG